MKYSIFMITAVIILAACLSSCTSRTIAYYPNTYCVVNQTKKMSCKGWISVSLEHGFFHFGPHGPWRDATHYGIYFDDADLNKVKYVTVESKIVEFRGFAKFTSNDYIDIQLQCKNNDGNIDNLPINGNNKIDLHLNGITQWDDLGHQ